jgi:hypothetical protein
MASCAPSGMRAPLFTSKQKREKRKKNNLFHVQIKKSRWVVKYSAIYVESKNTFQFAQSSGCHNGKPMDCKYAVVQSSGRVVECYRGKRTQLERLDGASVRDPSLNLPQEVDNCLRINQPHSQAPPEWRGWGWCGGEGEKWWAKFFSQCQAKEVKNKNHGELLSENHSV